ncbi:MAG: hypothetical protein JRD47_10755 [Deltaproteobacteria bacterium]|jgi:hypothetical protein|nr:hypothetical protein [Deltaproteobacteria bacterium]
METHKLFGIWAVRSKASRFGSGQFWLRGRDGRRVEFPSRKEAINAVEKYDRDKVSKNIKYQAKRIEQKGSSKKEIRRRVKR